MIRSFARNFPAPAEALRLVLVCGCALAVICAGPAAPGLERFF